MTRSEVYNCDCIEYMRTLPDGYFDIAVCDPPYGKGNDDTTSRFTTSGKFRRYFATKKTDCVSSPPLTRSTVTDSEVCLKDIIPPPKKKGIKKREHHDFKAERGQGNTTDHRKKEQKDIKEDAEPG